LLKGYATNGADRVRLSAATRNAWEQDEWLELSAQTMPILVDSLPKPDPVEMGDLLLAYLARHYKPGGKPVHLDYQRDYPLVYAENSAGLVYVVRNLTDAGLIERTDKSDRPQFRIAIAGYERLRASRAAHHRGASMEWPRAKRALDDARQRLLDATTEERCQAIGLLCREAMISAAQVVYDPTKHAATDDVTPSATDAKRMLDAVIAKELPGEGNAEMRAALRAAVKLADAVQHQRTADRKAAAICIEATESAIRLLGLVMGD
jgi:hypothetical protein